MTSDGAFQVQRRHLWSGVLWAAVTGLLLVAWMLDNSGLRSLGLAGSAVAAAYTICASHRATAMEQQQAFELGRDARRIDRVR